MAEISLSEFNERRKPQPVHSGITIPPKAGLAALAVVLLVASFFAGVQYQKSKHVAATTTATTSSSQGTGGQSGGAGGFGGGFRRGDRAFGTVSSVSASSITIQTRQGTSSSYDITSSTTVTNDGQSASVSDIQTGDTVIMTLDSSNTQDVTSIELNPSFGGGMGGNSSQNSSGSSDTTDNGTSTSAVGV